MPTLEFTIPVLPKMLNTFARMHHWDRTREREKWLLLIKAAIENNITHIPDTPRSFAKLTFIRRSSSEPDYDGLVGSCKIPCDILVELGILKDDKLSNTGPWDVSWEKVAPKKGNIYIKVEY